MRKSKKSKVPIGEKAIVTKIDFTEGLGRTHFFSEGETVHFTRVVSNGKSTLRFWAFKNHKGFEQVLTDDQFDWIKEDVQ